MLLASVILCSAMVGQCIKITDHRPSESEEACRGRVELITKTMMKQAGKNLPPDLHVKSDACSPYEKPPIPTT